MTSSLTKALVSLKTRLAARDRGATAVEYGLLVALIAAAIVVAVGTLGGQIAGVFNNMTQNIPAGP